MAEHDRRHDGEPQASAALVAWAPWITAEETIKDTLLIGRADADAVVLAFGAGNEILQPLAIVVLGGLITSTALTLLVLPALYARFSGWLLPRLKPALREA